MSTLLKPFTWFYHAFGLVSIQDTGRNAYLIILARACRMFAYGTNSLILALFFAELQFSDYRIGLFMTLTLLGDVFLGLGLTLIADRYGRRKILFGGTFLMVLSGATFAVFENFWILLFAAVVGVVSATGGDFGPFRAIEESILSQLTTPRTRSDVLAWYVTTSTVGSAIGSEASGRIIHALQSRDGWRLVDAYHALFWIYTAMGIVNALLVLLLTDACEMQASDKEYAQVAQDEGESVELETHQETSTHQQPNGTPLNPPKTSRMKRMWTRFSSQLAQISATTRAVMYKLWALLAVDSIADGMFWVAFLAAGAFRLAYDVGLYVMFINMQLYKHEGGASVDANTSPMNGRRSVEEEDMVELHRLSTPDSSTSEGTVQDPDIDKH
ncbi:hypothetical protein LTR48_006079 [Friedmanniomyces endolithicus]|nr:hypothetical protein LTR48_006079 [Friedmanniomyces endolithicus]